MATDVASKGLDFPDIQHVINYDMPDEIENYVHRIGRTGRCGKTGIATTFINKNQSESILLDLKHLLQEAKQRIPPVLTVCLALESVVLLALRLMCSKVRCPAFLAILLELHGPRSGCCSAQSANINQDICYMQGCCI